MLELADYALGEVVYSGPETRVLRAVHRPSGARVAIKLPAADRPSARVLGRLVHEHEMLAKLATVAEVAKVRALEQRGVWQRSCWTTPGFARWTGCSRSGGGCRWSRRSAWPCRCRGRSRGCTPRACSTRMSSRRTCWFSASTVARRIESRSPPRPGCARRCAMMRNTCYCGKSDGKRTAMAMLLLNRGNFPQVRYLHAAPSSATTTSLSGAARWSHTSSPTRSTASTSSAWPQNAPSERAGPP